MHQQDITSPRRGISWVRELIQQGIETDEEEDRLYGDKPGDELPGDIDREKIREKI